MARTRKQMANGPIAVPVPISEPVIPASTSRISSSLRFPFLVVLSYTISTVLYTFTSAFTAGDLATVSRSLNAWWEVAGLAGWKAAELAVGWWGGYDAIDLASMTVLSHMPSYYLLTTFYAIRPATMLCAVTIDCASAYVPFHLLRPVSPQHRVSTAPKGSVANAKVLKDFPIKMSTVFLAQGIYALAVFGSFYTWLPVYLVTHFDGLRDISAAHSAAFPFLILAMFPVGVAAMLFLFQPTIGAKRGLNEIKATAFNPVTATLWETVVHNLWGCSETTKIMIKRTVTLVLVTGLNTWLQTYVRIEGAEAYGAAGWAGIWVAAAAATGLAYRWVANASEVSLVTQKSF